MQLSPVTYKQTLALRQKVLRPHQSEADCIYPGDDIAGHFAFINARQIVAIMSVFPEDEKGEYSADQWRIRGVATQESFRRQGLASALLNAAEQYVVEQQGRGVWCNARVTAYEFYVRHGYSIESEKFEISGIGDHYRMSKTLSVSVRGDA